MHRVRQTIGALIFAGLIASPFTSAATPQLAPPPVAPDYAGAPAPAESFEGLLQRAQQLTQAERHQEALQAWQAAYAMRQRPGLWLEIGRSQQRLGMTAEASASYRRFLTADPNPPPALKAEAEQGIVRLERLVLPTPGLPGPAGSGAGVARSELSELLPYKVVRRRYHGGMRAGGITLFAIGYAAAFITGIVMGPLFTGSGSSGDKAVAAGSWALLVPVAGPFLSGIVAPSVAARGSSSGYGSTASSLALIWTLPWLLTSGGMQAAGVGMWAGAYRHPQNVIVPNAPELSLRLSPYAGPNGGGMAASIDF